MEEGSRRPTPDHPPYSEMVQRAIVDLAEVNGSTEPAISDYIRAHYASLPWAHHRLLPYYLHKLLLSGEITRSPLPDRYTLPSNPNPTAPRKRGRPPNPNRQPKPAPAPPKRGRGRCRKAAPPELAPVPGPRLILKLKRSNAILVDPAGGVYAGSRWRCLREDAQVQGGSLKVAAESEEDSDGTTVDAAEGDFGGATVDEHYDELLALRESDLNGVRTGRHGEEFMALRDEELDGITIDEVGKDLERVLGKEHDEGLPVMQEEDHNGSNGGLVASRENDLDGTKTELHGKESMSLRDEELNHFTVDGPSEDVTNVEREEAIQEKDSGGVKIDTCVTESDQGTPHKKAKPRKSRRLWYES